MMKFFLLLLVFLVITILVLTSVVHAEEDKLEKFKIALANIQSHPKNGNHWKTLANGLHPGESFPAPDFLGTPPVTTINKLYCLAKALELQPGESSNWVELGFALLDPRQRMFAGSTVVLSQRRGTSQHKITIDAKHCFVTALESHGADGRAWLGLAKVLTLEVTTALNSNGIINAKNIKSVNINPRVEWPDGQRSFSRLDCLLKSLQLDSTSKYSAASAWFELGMFLKQKFTQQQGEPIQDETVYTVTVSTASHEQFIVNHTSAFKKSLRIDFEFGEAWLELADSIFTPAIKQQINNKEHSTDAETMTEAKRYALIKKLTGQDDIVLADESSLSDEEKSSGRKDIFDARRMVILALKYNAGLGHAWHLLAEMKPSRSQVERERRANEAREAEEKRKEDEAEAKKQLEAAEARRKRAEAKAALADGESFDDDDDDDDEASITAAEEAEKQRKLVEQREIEYNKEDPFKFLLDENSKHKLAGDDVWKHSLQECLQGALEAIRPTPRPAEAWFQLSQDLKDQQTLLQNNNNNIENNKPGAVFAHVSGAQMNYRQCLQASLTLDSSFEPAIKALCADLKLKGETEITIGGNVFSVSSKLCSQ